ncbi:MAG: hypothetical protein H6668_08670 [Ardenticatenaceae bacterium]|nr:hypothetical protein [Ardenticatenaceae bacterium]
MPSRLTPISLYTLDTKLKQAPVLRHKVEMDEFAKVFFKPQSQANKADHGLLNKWIDPAVDRFNQAYRPARPPPSSPMRVRRSKHPANIRLYAF